MADKTTPLIAPTRSLAEIKQEFKTNEKVIGDLVDGIIFMNMKEGDEARLARLVERNRYLEKQIKYLKKKQSSDKPKSSNSFLRFLQNAF